MKKIFFVSILFWLPGKSLCAQTYQSDYIYHERNSYYLFQSDSLNALSFRIELGLGFSAVGEGGGLNGRFALVVFPGEWGGTLRYTVHDGGEGNNKSSWFGGTYRPTEKFYDSAVMLSHASEFGKKSKFIKSLGIGFFSGEKLTKDKNDLDKFDYVTGIAWEISVASQGRLMGITISLLGNINKVSSLYGITLSFSLGS